MRSVFIRSLAAGAMTALTIAVAGCGSNTGNNPGASQTKGVSSASSITVTVNGPATVTIGNPVQFSASVSGTSNQGVTWSVDQIPGGNAQVGTINSSGVYSPPAVIPPSPSVSISAVSVADTSASQVLPITLQPSSAQGGATSPNAPVSIALSGPSTVTVGDPVQYAAIVTGTTSQAVTWTVNQVTGGNTQVGSISSSGLYTPPSVAPSPATVLIGASSVASPSAAQALPVTVQAAAAPGSPAPTTPVVTVTLNGPTTVTTGTSVQYAAIVAGSADQGVSWSVNQVTGGSAQFGTISSGGVYTPPSVAPSPATILIGAVSLASPDAAQSLGVTIQNASTPGQGSPAPTAPATTVTISGPGILNVGNIASYSAVVAGTQNQAVQWAINGVAGGNAQTGTISSSGLYTPPAQVPAGNNIVVNATSVETPAIVGTLNATLFEPVPVIASAVGSSQGGGPGYLLDVQGTNFVSGATILVGGRPVATSQVGPDDLQAILQGGAQQIQVAVQNPNPGQTLSNTVSVALSAPVLTPAAAARFLDQATFGPTPASIAHVQQIGLQAALNEQFQQPATLFTQPPSPYAECPVMNVHCTQSDFLKIAVFGNDQLRQRVAMALSELFVAPDHDDNALPFYLNTLANDSFTNYRTIMQDVTLSPTMGMYLNMANSAKAPAGQIPNENYARELMQLFSIGLNQLNPDGTIQADANGNPLPTYTELQVQAFARAFTGWTWALPDGTAPGFLNTGGWNWKHAMVAVENQHDQSAKIVLGGTVLPAGQTAEQDVSAAIDNIFAQPNVGPFVSRQLIQHLVTGNPSPGYVERVAAVFANNGSGVRGDMKAVLTAILLDEEARAGDVQTGDQADTAPAVDGGHLREPLLWVTNLLRGLQATQVNPSDPYPFSTFMDYSLNSAGEPAFSQPSVFNYFSPSYVIPQTQINSPEFGLENTGSILPRLNLADVIIHNSPVGNQPTGFLVDMGATSTLGQAAGNPEQLVDTLGTIFMHSQMPGDMRSVLINAVSAVPATDPQSRAEIATYLVVTSSQYKIMH